MIDPKLQELMNRPLDDGHRINHVWLPEGKRPAKKGPRNKVTADFDPNRITPSQARQRAQDAKAAKLEDVMKYYASTSLPFDKIAEYTGQTIETVKWTMNRLGRIEG